MKNEIKVIFSNNDGYSGTDFIFANDIEPSIVVSNNNIYVTWYDGSPGNFEILLSKSTNGGESFNIPENISNNQCSSQEPEIALMQ